MGNSMQISIENKLLSRKIDTSTYESQNTTEGKMYYKYSELPLQYKLRLEKDDVDVYMQKNEVIMGKDIKNRNHVKSYYEGTVKVNPVKDEKIEGLEYKEDVFGKIEVYEGKFKDNKYNGHGVYRSFTNCRNQNEGNYISKMYQTYTGYWLNGQFHGKGFLKHSSKFGTKKMLDVYESTYSGDFRNHCMHGNGSQTVLHKHCLTNEIKVTNYVGKFENNKFVEK